jgi:hypothetical protein
MGTTGRDVARVGDAEFSTCRHCNEGIFRPSRHGVWVHVLTRQPKQALDGRIHRAEPAAA